MPFTFLPLPSLARDATGTLYLAITPQNGERGDIHYVTSTDDGATWSEPVPVLLGRALTDVAGVWPDAHDDYATMAWFERSEQEPHGWRVAGARLRGDEVLWAGNLTEPVAADRVYEFLMVRHDAEGRAHLVYPAPGDGCAAGPTLRARNHDCVRLLSENSAQSG